MSTGEDGSYLLRDSNANPGDFTLSVRYYTHFLILYTYRSKNAVKHFPVRWDGNQFTFGFGRFANVHELTQHFDSKPVIGGDSGKLHRFFYLTDVAYRNFNHS